MILHEIAECTRIKIEEQKNIIPLEFIKEEAFKNINFDFVFEKALRGNDIEFICEIKKASPSKGIIAENFPYVDIAKEYEQAGAAAISVLTEPFYFQGRNEYLTEISENVSIPILRKDFTIDEYMIYEAKFIGADAILLICSLLSYETLKKYIDISHSIGLSALVEAHDKYEVSMAVEAGARIIGINNRDLKTFTVDFNNSVKLRKLVPPSILFISESGIKTSEEIDRLREIKTDAVLIGETFMRSDDKKLQLEKLRGKYE